MARTVRINLKGLSEFARLPEMHRVIDEKAREMAAAVEAQGLKVGALEKGINAEMSLPVEVYEDDTTSGMSVNRAQARVYLAHPGGWAVQAKHGALTKAAAEAGLTVKSRRR